MSSPQPDASLSFDIGRSNAWLRSFIRSHLEDGTHFVVPRLAGIENDVAALGAELEQTGRLPPNRRQALTTAVSRLKRHAGLLLEDDLQIQHYSRAYLGAFHAAKVYFTWAPWGNVARYCAASYQFVESNFQKPKVDARVLDVFEGIHSGPWTRALKGKRILIVSAFVDSIKRQIDGGVQPYPIDLFPGCSFVFVKPPQTHGNNPARAFAREFEELVDKIREIRDDFDVALCSCGGYGNPLCAAIADMDRSAIYVGGVLQMYFGIYGSRWEREAPELLKAYKHDNWVRPAIAERPAGYESIEKACYW